MRGTMIAGGLLLAAIWSGGAGAAPVAPANVVMPATGLALAQWGPPPNRHVRPRPPRCWWENRRVRDHRGRWVVRRVQVCMR
ncbi:hypothetical protein [Chelatococcus asaccharovorans]|nr:hypothetical protein [Chelatococcus asaccharovorans]